MRHNTDTTELWVCVACIILAANGDTTDDADRPPLALLADDDVTVGRTHHDDACVPGDECECERLTFSHTPCDGCGSDLAGERHAMTLWERSVAP